MNSHQIRAIRNSFHRDIIHLEGSGYGGGDLIKEPLMRKSIRDIKLCRPVKDFLSEPAYILTKNTTIYKLYMLHYNNVRTMYVITKNDKIIYWTTSSIFAPASAAWHVLTEVYGGYRSGTSSWQWRSADDFDCVDTFLTNSYNKEAGKHSFEKENYYHSDYQINMWNKTKKYYIDKQIISQGEALILASKEYYHT